MGICDSVSIASMYLLRMDKERVLTEVKRPRTQSQTLIRKILGGSKLYCVELDKFNTYSPEWYS